MILFVALVFGILAFGSQVVLSLDFKFELSRVEQCEPVSITFISEANVNAIPMVLTLIPFGSTPTSIPIPNAAANTSGVYVTFFPFSEGTTFVASLDDMTGENVAKISDVIRVLPSPTGDTTCLPDVQAASSRLYTINDDISQCKEFTVKYNQSMVTSPPTVRLYSPRGPSFSLNRTGENLEGGFATYLMSHPRDKEVVLLFDDGFSHRETSSFITIGGDSESDEACLHKGSNVKKDSDEQSPSISRAVIIGSAAGGGAIVLMSISMLLFILRERRRRHLCDSLHLNPALLEKGPSLAYGQRSPSPQLAEKNAYTVDGYVRDPPYTAEKFLTTTTSVYPRASMASWAQSTPEDQRFPAGQRRHPDNEADDRLSLSGLDIEGILNMAAVQSSRSSRQTAEPIPIGPSLPLPAYHRSADSLLAIPRPYPARGHLRDPSDVPVGPTSMASTDGVNPFTDTSVFSTPVSRPLSKCQRSLDSVIRSPPGALMGLPSSPRSGRQRNSEGDGMEALGVKASNRSTRDSLGDWYGVAQ